MGAIFFIFPQDIMHIWFAFDYIFVFQNSICKINTITHFNFQVLFYSQWYIIGSLDLFDTNKGWHQTTETTDIQWLLTILEYWGIIVKLKCFCWNTVFLPSLNRDIKSTIFWSEWKSKMQLTSELDAVTQ